MIAVGTCFIECSPPFRNAHFLSTLVQMRSDARRLRKKSGTRDTVESDSLRKHLSCPLPIATCLIATARVLDASTLSSKRYQVSKRDQDIKYALTHRAAGTVESLSRNLYQQEGPQIAGAYH